MNPAPENAAGPRSPFNALPPKKIRDLPRAFLLEQLEKYYGVQPPAAAVEVDYSLWECAETGLQFAWPMRPGNACFYEWLSGFPSYYPGRRWEYGQVRRLLKEERRENPLNVLDVGCGKGDFLHALEEIPAGQKFALDFNEPAIEACRQSGFRAFCGTIDAAAQAGFLPKEGFPVVTAFHCLEHVDDPVGFVRSLLKVTAPGGRIYLSTPCSPMSFESVWFDVLNHPPHHLSRWNLAAYRRLAELLGLKLRYFAPRSTDSQRATLAFRLLHYGPHRPAGRVRVFLDRLRHFSEWRRLYREQQERARRNGGIGADVILVELKVS